MKEENSSRCGFTSSFNIHPSAFGRRVSWFWQGCKPNSVCALWRRESFVSATDTRNLSAFADAERAAPRFPIWPCTRWGFPCRVACASRGALLPHLFTLTAELALNGGLIFCGTVRRKVFQLSACVYLLKSQI